MLIQAHKIPDDRAIARNLVEITLIVFPLFAEIYLILRNFIRGLSAEV